MLRRLDIENFRALKDFHVEHVGRVNLIVGRNNAGKSTVLEAIRVFAGNAQRSLLESIAREHDESYGTEEPSSRLAFQDFFTREPDLEKSKGVILIGDRSNADNYLTIENVHLREFQETVTEGEEAPRIVVRRRRIDAPEQLRAEEILRHALAVTKSGKTYNILLDLPNRPTRLLENLEVQRCSIVPTHLVPMDELAKAWDGIVFTESERLVSEAIRFIAPDFEALTFVETADFAVDRVRESRFYRKQVRRIPIVKMSGLSGSYPLKSLGDGVARIFQLSLKLLESRNGFLLIDEFENGIHYSVEDDVWRFIFKIASQLNIQVFATTHSWDCIESFARIVGSSENPDGALFRVGRSVRTSDHGNVIATLFTGDQLSGITQSDLEIR